MRTLALLGLLLLLPPTRAGGDVQVLPLNAPSPAAGGYPALAVDAAGAVHMLWTAQQEGAAVLRVATWQGLDWSRPEEVARGADWFVNWADYPQLAVGADGTRMATWLQRSGAGSYDYGVQFALRPPGAEASWSAPRRLHSHAGGGEHGFVSLLPEGDGFRAVWLDGRATAAAAPAAEGGANGAKGNGGGAQGSAGGAQGSAGGAHGGHGGHGGGAMALYTAHVAADGAVRDERALDERVCDCCATALTALPDGGWGAAYRDRSADEVRDLGWVTADPEAAPASVHADGWRIEGCPVNGPAAARSGARVAVAWFTMAADGKPRCRFAVRGEDGSFAAPLDFDLGAPAGRTALCAWPGGGFLLAWMEEGKEPARWMARTWLPEQGLGEPKRISAAPGGRASGFLALAPLDDGALAAWTDARSGRLRCAHLRDPAADGR